MARSFDGNSQYCHAASAAATAPPIAMSCWFWVDPTISQGGTLMSLTRPHPSSERFELTVSNAPTLLAALANSSTAFGIAVASTNYSTGIWQHAFAVWYSSSDRKVWLNGGSQGSDTTSCTPTGIAETCLAASRITLPFSHFKGSLAEVAVWAGSGVESMGVAEAATLAKGFSPRCLGRRLGNLVLYQDLIRPLNHPGTGPAMIAVASPAVAAHPRALYPTNEIPRVAPFFDWLAFNPYHADAAMIDAGVTAAGVAASTGVELGQTIPIGEVSI